MEETKKVTFFIGSLAGGGAERVTCNLANYLHRNGFLVDIITMSDIEDTYKVSEGIKRFYLIHKKERSNVVHDYIVRRKRLKQYLVDNRNVSCYITMLPITIFMLIRMKKYIKGKIIISERCNPASYGLIKRLMMKYSAKRCDGLVVQTKEIGNWYKDVKNIIMIPNAINEDIMFPERKKIAKKIVAVGRLEKQKNYPMIIRAFFEFHKKFPDYTLEIYGKGAQEKEIRRLIEKYHLIGGVKLMGYVENISKQIANATCFVMTSNFEGMPNALIEAMCIGIPCIATDCDGGGARSLIRNGKNGILIQKNDINQLVKSLCHVASDTEYVHKISMESIKLRETLSYDEIYGKWLKTINKVVWDERK